MVLMRFTHVLLLLVLLLHRCAGSSSALQYCNDTPIPYPFYIIDSGTTTAGAPRLEGFEVSCPFFNDTPYITLRDGPHLIRSISLETHRIYILSGPISISISTSCFFAYGHTIPLSGADLIGTPFTFSSVDNKFTLIGCDTVAFLNSSAGCASFCTDLDSIVEGSCSGVGCCQTNIPTGLKHFPNNLVASISDIIVSSITDRITNVSYWPRDPRLAYSDAQCGKAYIVEQGKFNFSKSDVISTHASLPLVLEWAIGNDTCDIARKNLSSFACKDTNSNCSNSPDNVGYRCHCNPGYNGNPYLQNGCEDVDECSNPDLNNCVSKCINTNGSFHCGCPSGTHGDGIRNSTECKGVEPLDIGLGVGLVFLITVFSGGSWAYWVLLKRKIKEEREKFFKRNGGPKLQGDISRGRVKTKIYTMEELENATECFSQNRVIGRGGYGDVYKGTLTDGSFIAIKKLRLEEKQISQFINEVVILSQVDHANVVKLLGCCLESQVPMLVYEFISNRTLYHHLHEKLPPENQMSWGNRLRIAWEIASALAYLHSADSIPIIHSDIKSANILLDDKYIAKVSDFGASRFLPYDQSHVSVLVQGTWGYLDPEFLQTCLLTPKSDVYSFGIILIEILTGEKPVSRYEPNEKRNLASYFIKLVEQDELLNHIHPATVSQATTKNLISVAELAKSCLSLRGQDRPEMKDVVIQLGALMPATMKQETDLEAYLVLL